MKTELIVFNYKTNDPIPFQDTYLAAGTFGLKLGLEFSGDVVSNFPVGSFIIIDKNNKTINPWADGLTQILGTEPSSIFPPPGTLVFTDIDLQQPISFTSGEDGVATTNSNTEYLIYESLDLKDNASFPLTFSIADIRSPDKRNASFSKTITLPGTKKNNKFFGSIFEVGIDGTFDVTKKVRAVVYQQGLEQLNGILQLKKVNRDDYNNISYEIVLLGQLANIFANLGELKLCDLDFSEYNHIYTYSSITESWDTSIRKNDNQYINFETGYTTTFTDTEFLEGKVVLITDGPHSFNLGDTVWVEKDDDTINPQYNGTHTIIQIPDVDKIMISKLWGTSSTLESGSVYVKNTTGEGYVYPFLEYGNNTIPSRTFLEASRKKFNTILNPAIYTKTVVDKIFSAAKFTYNSDFFESPYFKRLILPYVGENYQLDTTEIQLQEFRAGITGTTQIVSKGVGASPVQNYVNYNADSSNGNSTIDCYDNNNNYILDSVSSRFRSLYNTSMRFQSNINFTWNLLPTSLLPNPPVGYWYYADSTLTNWGTVSATFIMYLKDGITGSFTELASTSETLSTEDIQIPLFSSGGYVSPVKSFTLLSDSINLKPNDEVFCEMRISNFTPVGANLLANGFSQAGALVNLNVLPNTSSRFLNLITNTNVKIGNSINLNKLFPCEIKCSDFLMGLVKLFNLYIDDEKGITNQLRIEPRDDYYATGQLLDYTNKLDISKSIEITPLAELNNKEFEFSYKPDNDYWNENYTFNTTQVYGYKKITANNDFVKGVSRIETLFSPSPQIEYANTGLSLVEIKKVTEQDGASVDNNTKANIRILNYGGLKTYSSYYSNNSNTFKFWFPTGNTTTFIPQEYYPYAGMEDDGYVNYTSLSYGLPIANQYFRPAMSNGTLYNIYWGRYIFEIGNRNSRTITCNLYLTPEDIYNLDFRNTFHIDGIYYRLNKISDYNPLIYKTTKCEFIKVEDSISFITQVKDVTNGNDDNYDDTDDTNPQNNIMSLRNNQGRNIGLNNTISNQTYTVLVNGNNNNILQDSANISIIGGDNNTILGGLNNVTIIGTDNIVVTDSNTTVTNGNVIKNGISLPSMNNNSGGLDIVFSLSSSITTNTWESGLDVVINIGSNETNNSIDGSINEVYEA